MDLLHLCLTSSSFQYNGKHDKLHRTAMGSPVSVVVGKIARQNIEEQFLATYSETLYVRLGYIDNKSTAVYKNKTNESFSWIGMNGHETSLTRISFRTGGIFEPNNVCFLVAKCATFVKPIFFVKHPLYSSFNGAILSGGTITYSGKVLIVWFRRRSVEQLAVRTHNLFLSVSQ